MAAFFLYRHLHLHVQYLLKKGGAEVPTTAWAIIAIAAFLILAVRAFMQLSGLFWNLHSWDWLPFTLAFLRLWVWDEAKLAYHSRPYSERLPNDTYYKWRVRINLGRVPTDLENHPDRFKVEQPSE